MPIRDEAAQNASLDNDYGTTRGPNAANSHAAALFAGDPALGGTEITGAGYARATVLPADWMAASGGVKTVVIAFPAPSGVWDSATHVALFDSADGTTLWDYVPLTSPLEVTAASASGPLATIRLFYNNPGGS